MENATGLTKELVLEDVIATSVQIPGVKVNRNGFLSEQFASSQIDMQKILDLGPIEAGISQEEITNAANKLIIKRTSQSSIASFVTGIPGGLAMAATIPADVMQFLGMALRLAQELSYLYGGEDLWTDGKIDDEVQLADSGYGQGQILVNPIHMASIYSAFVNNGNMIKPTIIYDENKKPEYLKENAISEEAANIIKDDLVQVVENSNGTAHDAKINGVKIGAKTGTAELKASKDEDGEVIGWFNAFTADENADKQLVVVSMVEDANSVGGSHYLFPKVTQIFK